MLIKGIVEEDFSNYKKASMFICFPYCSFKCEKESGVCCCQNSSLTASPNIETSISEIINRYTNNPITSAIVLGGLEPFDSWNDLYDIIKNFRLHTLDDIVIYTGYYEDEISDKINSIKQYGNIIVKFGRFIPNSQHKFDDVLGVELASKNQYAKRI